MIEVVAGLIEVDNKYLIAKRTYGDEPAKNKWEFPGGKIESGETDEQAMIRELKEEFNMDIEVLDYLCEHTQVYETRTIHLKLYMCRSIGNTIDMNNEHTEYALVDFDDIANYDLAPADKVLYELIKL